MKCGYLSNGMVADWFYNGSLTTMAVEFQRAKGDMNSLLKLNELPEIDTKAFGEIWESGGDAQDVRTSE